MSLNWMDTGLVLASNSPRRRELLALGGWHFRVLAADVDETPYPGEAAPAYVVRLAKEKALAAARQIGEPLSSSLSPVTLSSLNAQPFSFTPSSPEGGGGLLPLSPRERVATGGRRVRESSLIIAADTTVADEGNILGKPADAAEAESMLRRLRGRQHQVYTALAVLRTADGRLWQDLGVTDVPMRLFSDEEIQSYVSSGDPLDKAGAYAIQHAGFHPVASLQGCYANVMGLPLCHLTRLLRQVGIQPEQPVADACQAALAYTCGVYAQILGGAS